MLHRAPPKPTVEEMRHFLDCVENGSPPETTPEESLEGLEVIWKLYEAEENGTIARFWGEFTIDGVRSKKISALREIFEKARTQKSIIDIKFENWLFTLLALSCFYYSNLRTMQFTHDPAMAQAEWKSSLLNDAVMLFVPRWNVPLRETWICIQNSFLKNDKTNFFTYV